MNKLLEKGDMKLLTIPVDENGDTNRNEFLNSLKELIGDDKDSDWIKDYIDLSSVPAPFYMYKRFVRITYTQLISTFIEDPKIIFRENYIEPPSLCNEYVLTTAALVALYKIGLFPACKDITIVIPNTLYRTICDETERIVQENNREITAVIGIQDGQLYLVESSEDEKMKNMDEAVKLKEYCAKFVLAENYNDLLLQFPENIQIKDVLGISDYDALLIAKDRKAILVASEPITSMVGSLDGINVTTIGLVDFLLTGRFTSNHLCQIHRHLLGDIYPFAGNFRHEDIAKGATRFLAHNEIRTKLKALLKQLHSEGLLRGLEREALIDRSAYYMAELNYIHPFREGNGRAIREFMRQLFLYNGFHVNWDAIPVDVLLQAMVDSVFETAHLEQILEQCIEDMDNG
ncbi:MAG: Fic/DOC family protein [Candidatus Limivicinus sp.]